MRSGKRGIWLYILVVSLAMLVGCGKDKETKTETLGYQAHTLGTIEKLDRVLGVTQYDKEIYVLERRIMRGRAKRSVNTLRQMERHGRQRISP